MNEKKTKTTTDKTQKKNKNKNKNSQKNKIEKIEIKLKKEAEEHKNTKDSLLRLNAEFDNYRKRIAKEKLELIFTAGENILLDLITIKDDLDRAFVSIDEAKEIKAVKEGTILIKEKLEKFLENKGVKEIKAIGEKFDSDNFDAVAKVPAEKKSKKGIIVDVIEKGYKLKDKIIRHPKVVVGS